MSGAKQGRRLTGQEIKQLLTTQAGQLRQGIPVGTDDQTLGNSYLESVSFPGEIREHRVKFSPLVIVLSDASPTFKEAFANAFIRRQRENAATAEQEAFVDAFVGLRQQFSPEGRQALHAQIASTETRAPGKARFLRALAEALDNTSSQNRGPAREVFNLARAGAVHELTGWKRFLWAVLYRIFPSRERKISQTLQTAVGVFMPRGVGTENREVPLSALAG